MIELTMQVSDFDYTETLDNFLPDLIRILSEGEDVNPLIRKAVGASPELSKKIVTLRDERSQRLREIGGENRLVKQIIDLALLTNGMLKGKSLTDFIQRSISLIEK